MLEVYNSLDERYKSLINYFIVREHESKALLLQGAIGVGKTTLAHEICEILRILRGSCKFFYYQITPRTDENTLYYRYIPSEKTRSGIKIQLNILPLALLESQKHATVVVLDEIDKSYEDVDVLLLDYIQNKRLSLYLDVDALDENIIREYDIKRVKNIYTIRGNAKNLYIILISNKMRELNEALMRRLMLLEIEYWSVDYVYNYFLSKYDNEYIAKLAAKIYEISINLYRDDKTSRAITIDELDSLVRYLIYIYRIKNEITLDNILYAIRVFYTKSVFDYVLDDFRYQLEDFDFDKYNLNVDNIKISDIRIVVDEIKSALADEFESNIIEKLDEININRVYAIISLNKKVRKHLRIFDSDLCISSICNFKFARFNDYIVLARYNALSIDEILYIARNITRNAFVRIRINVTDLFYDFANYVLENFNDAVITKENIIVAKNIRINLNNFDIFAKLDDDKFIELLEKYRDEIHKIELEKYETQCIDDDDITCIISVDE